MMSGRHQPCLTSGIFGMEEVMLERGQYCARAAVAGQTLPAPIEALAPMREAAQGKDIT